MAFKFPKFEPAKFLIFIVLSIVLIGIVSFLISSIFPSVPILQVGIPFLLIVTGISIILPFVVIVNDGKFDKNDIIAFLAYGIVVFVFLVILPKILPQFFGDIPALVDSIKIFNSIIGLP